MSGPVAVEDAWWASAARFSVEDGFLKEEQKEVGDTSGQETGGA